MGGRKFLMKRFTHKCLGLITLIGACGLAFTPKANAQVQISPQLVRVSDGVELYLRRREPSWSRETLPPPGSGGNFIVDFYRLGDRYVKVVLSPDYSPEEAEYGLDSFSTHFRAQSSAKLEALGDEGYLWGNAPDHKNVTFRKGNVVVYMTAKLESDAKRFAYEVAAALPEGDRVGLKECSPARMLAAPAPLLKRWVEVSPAGGGFRALLPCDSNSSVNGGGGSFNRDIRTKRGSIAYRVIYSPLSPDEAREVQQMYARDAAGPPYPWLRGVKVISRRRVIAGGLPAVEYVASPPEGGFWRTILVASDTHSYTLMAFSSAEEMIHSAEVEEFFGSFKIVG